LFVLHTHSCAEGLSRCIRPATALLLRHKPVRPHLTQGHRRFGCAHPKHLWQCLTKLFYRQACALCCQDQAARTRILSRMRSHDFSVHPIFKSLCDPGAPQLLTEMSTRNLSGERGKGGRVIRLTTSQPSVGLLSRKYWSRARRPKGSDFQLL
jgi:hypothetical protein